MRQKKLAALRFRGLRKSHENCALLSPSSFQNQSGRFDFERKTEGTDMQLSRLFETGEAEWSEFRLTTARGLAKLGLGCF